GAGEETDFLLRAIQRGHSVYYDPSLGIWHLGRSGPYRHEIFVKARHYGMGVGRVLRKHRYPIRSVAYHVARPLGGALFHIAVGQFHRARYHWSIFLGRLNGWLARPEAAVNAPATPLISEGEAHLR